MYENILETTSEKDLGKLKVLKDEITQIIDNYKETVDIIVGIEKNGSKKIKTKVDIGCNFYMNATIPNTDFIYLNVGYGFFPQLTHQEAKRFIEKKVDLLKNQLNHINDNIFGLLAKMKLLQSGIHQTITDNQN